MNSKENREALSINRFREVDVNDLTDQEYTDFVLAKLMQEVIQRLEGAIQNDRIFGRTKYDVMAIVWEARDLLSKRFSEQG